LELNPIEFWSMNNPFRRTFQKYVEFQRFQHFLEDEAIDVQNAVVLDAGCGSGYEAQLIREEYSPTQLVGFDLMPDQIHKAHNRYPEIPFFVGDMTRIPFPPASFDVVFVFAVLHHIPAWKQAISEINRVLTNDGVLMIEDYHRILVTAGAMVGFDHPQESRFHWDEFKKALSERGFSIDREANVFTPWFRSFLCRKNT